MDSINTINLMHLFNFYLGLTFLASTAMRVRQYRSVLALVRAIPGRWPHLLALIKDHSTIFLTGSTILPAALAFGVFALNMLATYLIWPKVDLTLPELVHQWLLLPVLFASGLAMFAVDLYATFTVGEFDHELLQKYFDQAEYWLRSWTAPVVKVFTFGYVNPRQMVHEEVRKALLEASRLLNVTLWWVTIQVALRVGFGLSLWLTYAWTAS